VAGKKLRKVLLSLQNQKETEKRIVKKCHRSRWRMLATKVTLRMLMKPLKNGQNTSGHSSPNR
jgi:hypothetical protein